MTLALMLTLFSTLNGCGITAPVPQVDCPPNVTLINPPDTTAQKSSKLIIMFYAFGRGVPVCVRVNNETWFQGAFPLPEPNVRLAPPTVDRLVTKGAYYVAISATGVSLDTLIMVDSSQALTLYVEDKFFDKRISFDVKKQILK
jgi:hypothetical protein